MSKYMNSSWDAASNATELSYAAAPTVRMAATHQRSGDGSDVEMGIVRDEKRILKHGVVRSMTYLQACD